MNLDTKSIRDRLGLSQGLFAQVLGVHPITVSKWERGLASPDPYRTILLKAANESLKYDTQLGPKLRALLVFGHTAAALCALLRPSQKPDYL
jgi:transcriptional regulator with XRE-family HTH domain